MPCNDMGWRASSDRMMDTLPSVVLKKVKMNEVR